MGPRDCRHGYKGAWVGCFLLGRRRTTSRPKEGIGHSRGREDNQYTETHDKSEADARLCNGRPKPAGRGKG
jgi:hypothetical protein